jgi:hypothetical protein
VKQNKPKRHLETKHSEMKNKPEEYSHRKLDEICIQQKSFVNTATVTSKPLLASYQKPYMIAETVILPAAVDTLQTMFGEEYAYRLRNTPLSNNTASGRITVILEDLEEQLIEKVRNKRFSSLELRPLRRPAIPTASSGLLLLW